MIATLKKTNEIIDKYNLKMKKGYGQNFIIEPGIVEKIARLSLCQDIAVIEIGPGIGALTEQLSLIAKKVVSYEIDSNLIPILKDTLSNYNNVEIINDDFLNVDLKKISDELIEEYNDVVICANLPYYVTTPILFKIFESNASIKTITVMIQKEVADRFNAKVTSSDYNALSVITQYLYDVKIVMKVNKNVFNPKPKVDSSVIQFTKKEFIEDINREKFFEFVKACFKQRRKTLNNNLKEYINNKDIIDNIFKKTNIDQSIRAQQISLDKFIEMFKVYEELL